MPATGFSRIQDFCSTSLTSPIESGKLHGFPFGCDARSADTLRDDSSYAPRNPVSNEPFYIAFAGSAEQTAMLRRFVAELAAEKVAGADGSMIVEETERIIDAPKWLDLLDSAAIERLTDGEHWQLEDILDCMLHGEYQLLGVEYAEGRGRLLYDPLAFPFGGTDPMKALVAAFGLRVTRDSFHDGYAERKAAGEA